MKLNKKIIIIAVAVVVVLALAVTGILLAVNKNKKKNEAKEANEEQQITKVIDSAGDVVPFASDEENDDNSKSSVDTKNTEEKTEDKTSKTDSKNENNNGKSTTQSGENQAQNGGNQAQNGGEQNNNGEGESSQNGGSTEKTYYNYTYEDMLKNGNSLINKYGDSIKKEVIGTTLFGRDIVCFKVGNDSATRKMLVVSGVNGSEHDNALVLMKQIETYLADTNGTFRGKKYSEILDKCQIYFVPMLNPDGIEISLKGLDSVPEEYKSSVEEIASYSVANGLMTAGDYSLWNANGQGIDVSINFGDGSVVSKTLSQQPASKNFPGQQFASNEAQAIVNLCGNVTFETLTVYAGTGNLVDWSFGQTISAQLSADLANGLSTNTGFTVISNGPTYDFCITINLAQWFIYQYDRPAFSILMGAETPYSKNDVQTMWKAVSTAPLYLAVDGNGTTDYETIE